ncbi:MAG: FHA domain-containing protein [Deltaproteobacteria bacterium]
MKNLCIEIIDGPEKGKIIEFNKPTFFIGRADTNQLTLSDTKASRVHARLEIQNDDSVVLFDEDSSNGVFFRGEKITSPIKIFPGDSFILGTTTIRLITIPTPSGQQDNEVTRDVFQPEISYTRSLALDTETIQIGRDPSNDLVLDHPMVSRFHARIISQHGQHIIYDLQSVNGTYLDGTRVEKSARLEANSRVQICGFCFLFDGKQLIEYDESSGQIRIQVTSLGRTIKMPDGGTRKLLDDISFTIQPREFVAILGGSGAGKSTLMGALTGMEPANIGSITINSRNLYQEYGIFRSMIGYVPQEDIVHLDLTVTEVLEYSARLRMPGDTSPEEIKRTVDRVINDLELGGRRNVLVRNLSGGQRKRVSIGVELLTSPSMFFLDEPTSGLDPGLEKTMMEMLQNLAKQGRTIMLVTHATFNIKLCDKVIFLTEGGRLAFFGTPDEALTYFAANDFADIYEKLSSSKSAEQWASEYRKSPYCERYIDKNGVDKKTNSSDGHTDLPVSGSSSSSIQQWLVLTSRYARLVTRDRKNLWLLFLQPVIIASLIVLAFLYSAPTFEKSDLSRNDLKITQQVIASGQIDTVQENNENETKSRSEMSMCVAMMVFTAIWLGTSNSAREIVKELPIYKRERRVNLHITPYLMSKVTVLAAICLVQTLTFLIIIKLCLGLPNFWLCFAAFFIISLASVMMGLTVSATVSNTDKAMSTIPVLLVPQIVLSGALVPMSSVKPVILQSVFYLAISKWGFELVGGGICDINHRVALAKPLDTFAGDFGGHWWILAAFIVVFYLISSYTVVRKDND